MKLGVSSYSYSQLYSDSFTVFDAIGHAKSAGLDIIDFSGIPSVEGKSQLESAAVIRDACAKAGLAIANYAVGADFLGGSNGDLAAEIARVKGEVDIASALGASVMRHDATYGWPAGKKAPRGFDDALPRLTQGCREVTKYAATLGIKTTVENHGYFCQDSERVEKLINAVGDENFGVLLDIGNFMCVDEDPCIAVGRLAPYIFHVHAKDFLFKSGMTKTPGDGWFGTRGGNYLRGTIIGHGVVPVDQCIELIKRSGYDGAVIIEFEGMEKPLQAIELGAKYLRKMI